MTVVFYDPQGVILPPCIQKLDAEICLHYELKWNCQENHNIYRGGAITKAHGVLLQGRATMTVVFYDPRGSYFPLALRNLMQKFAFTINLHGIVRKTIISYSGVGCNKSPWFLTAGEGHHDSSFL